MASESTATDGILRRTVLKAAAVTAGSLAAISPASADGHGDENGYGDENGNDAENGNDDAPVEDTDVDEPDGFEVEVLAEHAPFVDDVAATFDLTFADEDNDNEGENGDEPIRIEMDDASTVIVAEVTWMENGRSGWHRHPGISLVSMVEGEIEVTWEGDCVPRTYSAGDAWLDPGEVHKADSEERAFAYVTFLDIPDGEPATEWVEPVEC